MQAETNDLQYADVNNDVVRSIVETGPKYYIALATAGGAGLTTAGFASRFTIWGLFGHRTFLDRFCDVSLRP